MAIKRYKIKTHSPEWYEFRDNGIGGSEVSTILRENPSYFTSTIMRTWAEKIGMIEVNQGLQDNFNEFVQERIRHGTLLESYVADKWWKYWEKDIMQTMHNQDADKVIRTFTDEDGYVVNDKYPWLFASEDRLIDKGQINLITNKINPKNGILEIKTISSLTAKNWDSGVPQYHLNQVHQYLIVHELDYGEIAFLEDGGKFYIEPVKRDDDLCDLILNVTEKFWKERVVPAKKLYEEYLDAEVEQNIPLMEKIQTELQYLEPEPDNTDGCRKYMSDRFKNIQDAIKVRGSSDDYLMATKIKLINAVIKKLEGIRKLHYNTLIGVLINNKAERIDFDRKGYLEYYKKANNSNFELGNRIKYKPSPTDIDILVKKLSL